jgi:hypothetical protein
MTRRHLLALGLQAGIVLTHIGELLTGGAELAPLGLELLSAGVELGIADGQLLLELACGLAPLLELSLGRLELCCQGLFTPLPLSMPSPGQRQQRNRQQRDAGKSRRQGLGEQ